LCDRQCGSAEHGVRSPEQGPALVGRFVNVSFDDARHEAFVIGEQRTEAGSSGDRFEPYQGAKQSNLGFPSLEQPLIA
jgi:hypothetical protein